MALFVASVMATVLPSTTSATSSPAPLAPAPNNAKGLLDNLPVGFEQNLGQVDPQVRYLSRFGGGHGLPDELLGRVCLQEREPHHGPGGREPRPDHGGGLQARRDRELFHRQRSRQVVPSISTYDGVTAEGVYPGVDLAWHGTGVNLEYDFNLAPGADPSQIAFTFKGQGAAQSRQTTRPRA